MHFAWSWIKFDVSNTSLQYFMQKNEVKIFQKVLKQPVEIENGALLRDVMQPWKMILGLRNDLYCVEWDVKPYYTIPYHGKSQKIFREIMWEP